MGTERTVARPAAVVAAFAIAVVGLQICYPLASGDARHTLTALIVLVLSATSLVHAGVSRGVRCAAAVLLLTAVPGFAVEVVGVHTGVPFGSYEYSARLGPRLFDVPVLVALAWTMLAWPAALVARRIARGFAARVALGAWTLAALDLFLDPQLVAAGGWRWHFPTPGLPGVPGVPLTNYLGWLGVSVVLSLGLQWLLDAAAPRRPQAEADRVMIALFLWLYVGWIVALGILHLAAAAGWGAAALAPVVFALAVRLRHGREAVPSRADVDDLARAPVGHRR